MSHLLSWALLPGLLALPSAASLAAQESTSLKEALSIGEVAVKLRYRYESVNEGAFSEDGLASTLRTTLSYRTPRREGLGLFLEAENVSALGLENSHNSGGNLGEERPVVRDPETTEVSQAYLRWKQKETTVDLGRREITLGDQRFVGNVGWRQNHQSFDALFVEDRSLDKVVFAYAYIDNVKRITGESQKAAHHLLNAQLDLALARLTLYSYRLDFGDAEKASQSTSTLGFELAGSVPVATRSELLWELEVANQRDFKSNPSRVSAGYSHLLLGARHRGLTLMLDYEVLEGSPLSGRFTTPLATLHIFNGWADKFLMTPEAGLEDLAVGLSRDVGQFGLQGTYHRFRAQSTSIDYGNEIDLEVVYETKWGQTCGLRVAFYEAHGFSTDTEKLWLSTTYGF